MSLNFEHVTLGQRVLFGSGKAAGNLAAAVTRLGARKVMVIASEFEALIAKKVTADISVTLDYDDVAPHVPIEKAEKARAAAQEHGIDLLVCVGGGSTTGLAKAIALTELGIDVPTAVQVAQVVPGSPAEDKLLVNDIFGGDRYAQFGTPLWEHDLEGGLRMLRMGIDTHVITSALALPLVLESGGGLLVEMTDGPSEVNRGYRDGVGFYYDYVKGCVDRLITSLTAAAAQLSGGKVDLTIGSALDCFGGSGIEERAQQVARGKADRAHRPRLGAAPRRPRAALPSTWAPTWGPTPCSSADGWGPAAGLESGWCRECVENVSKHVEKSR